MNNTGPQLKTLALTRYDRQAASTRYRVMQYAPALKQRGITLRTSPLFDNEYVHLRNAGSRSSALRIAGMYGKRLVELTKQQQFDSAIVYAELLPYVPGWLETGLLRVPYVYDFDDAFYLNYSSGLRSMFLGGKMPRVISSAAVVTAGNEFLADYARRYNRDVRIVPTVVDTGRYHVASRPESESIRIGWIGSPSTAPYLDLLRPVLADLGKRQPVTLVLIGGSTPDIDHVTMERHQWTEETEIELLDSLHIGLMPLTEDPWSRGKCAFKLIQYMASGLPVVASAVGANNQVVTDDCGFLCNNNRSWLDALWLLCESPDLRETMGLAGRQRVVEQYSLDSQADTLADAIRLTSWRT